MADPAIYKPFVGDYANAGTDLMVQGVLPVGIFDVMACVMPGQVTPLTAARSPVLQEMAQMSVGGVEPDVQRLNLTAGASPIQINIPQDKTPFVTQCKVLFEPYQEGSGDPAPDNVRPIKGWTGAEAKRADTSGGTPTSVASVEFPVVSANQWDEEWEVGSIKSTDGTNDDNSSRWRTKGYIPIPGQIYFVNGMGHTLGGRCYDKDKNYLGSLNIRAAGGEITLEEGTAFLRFVDTSTNEYSGGVAINYPSTVTTYNPYSRTIFGGWVDTETGEGEMVWKYVNAKDYTWSNTGSEGIYCVFNDKVQNTNTALCDSLNVTTYSSSNRIAFTDATPTRAEKLSLISDGDVHICYTLATPIPFTVSPSSLTLLKGENWAWAEMIPE